MIFRDPVRIEGDDSLSGPPGILPPFPFHLCTSLPPEEVQNNKGPG